MRAQLKTLSHSLTIAQLEREARADSNGAGGCTGGAGGHHHHGGSSGALDSCGQEDQELIVLRKNDLNSILTAKPTLLIGRELVSDNTNTNNR